MKPPEKEQKERNSTKGSATDNKGSAKNSKGAKSINFFAPKMIKTKKGKLKIHDHSGCKHENGYCLKLG